MGTPIDLISGRVAKELGLTELIVDQIHRSQYKFLLDTMQGGTMSGVSLIYLGKFTKNKRYESNKRDIPRIQEPSLP